MDSVIELSSGTIHQFPTNGYISAHRARDGWLGTMNAVPDMPANFYRTMIDLYLSFNCTTGQCNPEYDTIAGRLGVKRRTIERMVGLAQDRGGIKPPPPHAGVKRAFVLTIPSSEVATTAVAGSSDNSCRRFEPKKPAEVPTAIVAGVATDTDQSSDNCCRTEHWNTEGLSKSGAPAPRSVCGDSFSPVTEQTTSIAPPGGVAEITPVEMEKVEMHTTEDTASLARLFSTVDIVTIPVGVLRNMARAAGMPPGAKTFIWLRDQGLVEQVNGVWQSKPQQATAGAAA